MAQDNFITVTIRSHVPPSAEFKNFEFGKPFQISLEHDTTLEALLKQLFFENIKAIGFIVINGKLAARDRNLLEGDVLFIYGLILGG